MNQSEVVRNSPPQQTPSLRPGTYPHLLLGLFLAQMIFFGAIHAGKIPSLMHAQWPGMVVLALAAVSTLASLARWLPLQNVLSSAALIGVLGGLVEIVGTSITNQPAHPGQLNSTWSVPLVWVLAVLNCRGVGRLILQRWRTHPNYGLWLLGITALLVVLFLESFAEFGSRVLPAFSPSLKHPGWDWATVGSVLVRLFGSCVILLIVTPLQINKKPGENPPDWHPLIVWIAFNLCFLTAWLQVAG